MKDAGGVQQERDDAGDAKQEWRDRRGEAGVAEGWITKGRTGVHGADFPIQWHSSAEQLPPSGTGKRPPSSGQGSSRSWGVGQELPVPPLFPAPTAHGWVLGVALPRPSLPGPGSPGMSPQRSRHCGVPPGCLAAPKQMELPQRNFGTPRSQTAFDASSCGTRKISLRYQNPP